jgi:hypothetical protein
MSSSDVFMAPRVQWRWLFGAIGSLLLLYLALLNPYWVPSGDGDVYTAIARSIAQGDGVRFNGVRVAITPPGWPLVLAGAMLISPTFLFLKCVTIVCMLGTLAITFFILRRFVSDKHSAGIVMLTGILAPVYPLTYWMHTEAFFCLLSSGAVLCAMRIVERRPTAQNWNLVPEMVGLTLLLAAASFTRWPGFLHLVIIAAVLLQGPRSVWFERRRVVALVLATVACIGTFATTYQYLSLSPAEKRLARAAGAVEDRDGGTEVAMNGSTTEPTTLTTTQSTTTQTTTDAIAASSDDDETPDVFNAKSDNIFTEYLSRMVNAGRWFAWLLWYPSRFGQSVAFVNGLALLSGWAVIGTLVLALVAGVNQRQWLWVGIALYTGGLCLIWPAPNARYFVPVAPFILLGVILGLQSLKHQLQWSKYAGAVGLLLPLFIASIVVTNVALLTIDIAVFRSGKNFYRNYEGGLNEDLIAIARHLRTVPASRNIAVSQRYVNLGKTKTDSKYGVRALHLLTDRPILGTPRKLGMRPNKELNEWASGKSINVTLYVYQQPSNPWRLWHFRLPAWIQRKLSKDPIPEAPSGGWQLYEWKRGRGFAPSDDVLETGEMPVRVPGM